MRNVKINEAESIFEPFWDSGESYPDHEKYTSLVKYRLEPGGAGEICADWYSVRVAFHPGAAGRRMAMERDCVLDIRDYDVFRMFANVPESVTVRIVCLVDGEERELLCRSGKGNAGEYDAPVSGREITRIRLEFECASPETQTANIFWLGLSDREREARMLSEKSPYDAEWEGCFREDPDLTPQTGLYFDSTELAALREKLRIPCFGTIMDRLRREAETLMTIEPEQYVGEFTHDSYRVLVRDRDMGKPTLNSAMSKLAFVGIVDGNEAYLRMACRMALTLAHNRNFCESILGAFPGATWHHRSFQEGYVSNSIAEVLDWAGGLLTWHGKNILYDAIIMKGLPRLDADLKTMDYIWHMNQGPVFASHLIIALLALTKRYPRYAVRLEEAERDLLAMWEDYVQPDGGVAEGPVYWNYTVLSSVNALYLLARYHGAALETYLPEPIRKSARFAEALLRADGSCLPVNDTHPGSRYAGKTVGILALAEAGDVWKRLNDEYLLSGAGDREALIFGRLFGTAADAVGIPYANLPATGFFVLRRENPPLGRTDLYAVGGAITFGHAHGDKGSLVLDVGGVPALIDRGVCDYSDAYVNVIGDSELHNVLVPVQDGRLLTQETHDPAGSARVLEGRYENGVFIWETDVTPAWKGVFTRCTRRITSSDPCLYVVTDEFVLREPGETAFLLQTYGTVRGTDRGAVIDCGGFTLTVTAENWTPSRIESGPCGKDGDGRPVNRICLFVPASESARLVTELRLEAGT